MNGDLVGTLGSVHEILTVLAFAVAVFEVARRIITRRKQPLKFRWDAPDGDPVKHALVSSDGEVRETNEHGEIPGRKCPRQWRSHRKRLHVRADGIDYFPEVQLDVQGQPLPVVIKHKRGRGGKNQPGNGATPGPKHLPPYDTLS
jgi:hypothetical protein